MMAALCAAGKSRATNFAGRDACAAGRGSTLWGLMVSGFTIINLFMLRYFRTRKNPVPIPAHKSPYHCEARYVVLKVNVFATVKRGKTLYLYRQMNILATVKRGTSG